MGPMKAAYAFGTGLTAAGELDSVARVRCDLYGSLALTGAGHGTDRAVLLGLSGEEPATLDPALVDEKLAAIRTENQLMIAGVRTVPFRESEELLFHRDQRTPPDAKMQHPNGLRFTAFDAAGKIVSARTWFSIGGGFIVEDGIAAGENPGVRRDTIPYPFHSSAELLETAAKHQLTVWQLMLANEAAIAGSEDAVKSGILRIWQTMRQCIERGIATEGILPGGLNVRRRAHRLAERLMSSEKKSDPLAPLDWVTVYAMAVNEENAAGGRVVTAPTNGAAGIIPAVAEYYCKFIEGASEEGILRYFLTSAAIGLLYKENASISGAEVGCQGEVGVACSMAAGGLAAALGATNGQVEHAAEIGMEHNLGMTCDPIGGLVQIPCIERNAMGAVKAIQASRIALNENEAHKVSLDQVIRTMYLTGLDMQSRYKETSLAGLALNIIEC